ncbi:class I SAM-dependent methyltransferase (plasmid) [Sinorhizobium meliloti]
MQDFDDFFAECDLGPRINELTGFFTATAAGKSGMPTRRPVVDTRLLPRDELLHDLICLHATRQGFFDQHYHSSIPYRLEEECRMAYALLKYARHRSAPMLLYSLGTAEGTMARTLSELSGGLIRTLSCSPNAEIYKCFMAYGEPPHADFFLGPFHWLTRDVLSTDLRLAKFASGFDVVLEDTTFQMYSPNRLKQIEFVAQHLNEGGLLLLVEKFRALDENDYERREYQKDFGFKARYFPADEIERKANLVLKTMHNNEVTLAEMSRAVSAHFKHCVITWNSGNFYGLAASNCEENLNLYLSHMAEPAIPHEYVYEGDMYCRLPELAAIAREKRQEDATPRTSSNEA